ncbi:hypothetical protein [Nocardiopsis sp. NPDC006938]|uniref:hypothetical protein n=1 Tax=Nocardiopsis sp. NPDC006938 TaxID=3364337 RepID=UPI0036C1E790
MAATPKKTKKYHRVLCGKPTVDLVNFSALPQLTARAGRKLTQEEVVDALIQVGAAHLDEVAPLLAPPTTETDTEDSPQ